jgi:DNA polymerase-1
MARYYFDIETDGFLEECTKVHSLVLIDVDTSEMISCTDSCPPRLGGGTIFDKEGLGPRPQYQSIRHGLNLLMEANTIIGHNIIKFDIPVLEKLYKFKTKAIITDTLVLTRLVWSDLYDIDYERRHKSKLSPKLYGSHSLEAWGYRLGVLKGDYSSAYKASLGVDYVPGMEWEHWSPEMQSYCEQDVLVTQNLYRRIWKEEPSFVAVWVEHEFAKIIAMQERHGFAFDEEAAHKLYKELVKKRLEMTKTLTETFPPKVVEEVFIPKVNNKTRGYLKGIPVTKKRVIEFNPSSRQMIAERLIELGWKPEEFTPTGQPKVDETILSKLPYPEAKVLAEYFTIEKRIGQLAEGDQAWLRLVKKGRIHGSVNTNGAVTGRCTHRNPNVAQVPRVGSPYGKECRALFAASHGKVLVGADLSGLELRCLAHYMADYDNGEYGKVLLEGDVHTHNQKAAGLPTRNDAKTFIYAFLYGAGDVKIGSIVSPEADEGTQKKVGRKLKRKFLASTPALRQLRQAVVEKAEKGPLKGLDGRLLRIRSTHAALNTLLQSAGALIAKVATIFAYQELTTRGYKFGKDWALVAHVHDEMQAEARPEIAEEVGNVLVQSMRRAGEFFGFNIPIDGEWKIGNNWAETH